MAAMTTAPYSRVLAMSAELKAVGEGKERIIEGWASTDDVDETQEVVLPDAFTAGLPAFRKHPIYTYMHDWTQPVGRVVDIEVRDNGLWSRAKLMEAGTNPMADLTWEYVRQGVVNAQSIGFNSMGTADAPPGYHDEERNLWIWQSIQLREIAAVSLPANYETTLQMAKSLGLNSDLPAHGMVGAPFADLPAADVSCAWDRAAAEKRVHEWAGGPNSWVQYGKAFAWHDPAAPEDFRSYQLQIADVDGGELKVVWRAVAAALGAVHLRGGTDIPKADVPGVVQGLTSYCAKFGKAPLEEGGALAAETKAIYEETEFHENARQLRGLAISVSNIAAHWHKQGRVLSPASGAVLTETHETLGTVLGLHPTDQGDGDPPALRLALKPARSMPMPHLSLNPE